MRVGIDVGGTFTDLAALGPDGLVLSKVPTTPHDQSEAVLAAVAAAGIDPDGVQALAHGMTVATNALLERRGARTALVTTAGFRDVIEIGRQARADLYDLTAHHPAPLVPRDLRFAVAERMGPEGVVEALDADDLERVVGDVVQAEPEAVAVCLLFGYLHPQHEQEVAAAIREALPGIDVVASHEVLPEFREFERTAATVATAYLRPRLRGYLESLGERTRAAGLPAVTVMQSSGGVVDAETAIRLAATTVLSGPAGGVVGAAQVARAAGFEDALSFDMGGTSTDVAAIVGGEVAVTSEAVVAGVPLRLQMTEVHTVSAGGGSIAWVDDGGHLRVGPHSAGALPGPAAYGRGGEEPTVTDANLVLGRLRDGALLGGAIALDRSAAERAVAILGETLGLGVEETAAGIVAVADAEMARALRVVSVERGRDPRSGALVAFGGAGPLHACALAEDLGIPTVLVPAASGVLSALGLAVADVRRDHVRAARVTLPDEGELANALESIRLQAAEDLPAAEIHLAVDCRYAGQGHELTVAVGAAEDTAIAFHAAHRLRHGWARDDRPVEVVAVRATAVRPSAVAAGTVAAAADDVVGPVRIELDGATAWLADGWRGWALADGTLRLERGSA
jgi:N-methylhydantoinase A